MAARRSPIIGFYQVEFWADRLKDYTQEKDGDWDTGDKHSTLRLQSTRCNVYTNLFIFSNFSPATYNVSLGEVEMLNWEVYSTFMYAPVK